MKKILAYSLLLLLIVPVLMWFFAEPVYEQAQHDNPWQIESAANGATRVFGLDVGRLTLQELMMSLHKIAELSVFEDEQQQLSLEAYFGKTKLGIFDARLIAEMDASQTQLRPFIAFNKEREGTPSGRWKYNISSPEHIQQANEWRVWKLMYIPSANYEPVSIEKYFGKPDSKESISKQHHYWYYPQKSFVVLEDTEGKETFYYVAPEDYPRLLKSLPKQLAEQKIKEKDSHKDE
ncbi:MAG TPA: hypothetical protein ENK78_08175 [Thiothrix sp.]|nr:hypothetical protein [Thiothrix sp.]